MLQGEGYVSRDPALLLGNIIYALCHVSLNVRLKVKKNTISNSSYCELGPSVVKQGKHYLSLARKNFKNQENFSENDS